MKRLKIELILLFSVVIILLPNCSDMTKISKVKGKLIIADRDTLYIVDLNLKKNKVLYKTSEYKYMASPTYNSKVNLIAVEEYDFLNKGYKILIYNTITNDSTYIVDQKSPYTFPSFSVNGDLIAIQNEVNDDIYNVNIIDLNGNGLYKSTINNNGGKVSWSPNNEEIAFVNINDEIVIENITKGNSYIVIKGKSPIFSPTGNKLAYISEGAIHIIEIHKGEGIAYDNPGFFTELEQINAWIFDNKTTTMIVGLTQMSFFAEKHFVAQYNLGSNKFIKIYQVPTLIGYDWISKPQGKFKGIHH